MIIYRKSIRNYIYDNVLLIINKNLFYDSEPDPGHHRLGVGLEYKKSKFGISNNYYKALSGKKAYGPSGVNEEALDGVDVVASGFLEFIERLAQIKDI